MRVRLGETKTRLPRQRVSSPPHMAPKRNYRVGVFGPLPYSQGRCIKSRQSETQIFFNYITVFSTHLHSLHVSTYWGPMRLLGAKKGAHPAPRQIATIVLGTPLHPQETQWNPTHSQKTLRLRQNWHTRQRIMAKLGIHDIKQGQIC